MSYRQLLLKKIAELEEKISEAKGDKEILEQELNRLKLAEYEEDMRESDNQQLLKG